MGALRGFLKEPAYVAPAVGGWVGVYPEGIRTVDFDELAKPLSKRHSCGVFTWSVHDDDIFSYSLYQGGNRRDEFNSAPDYFEPLSKSEIARLRGKPEALVPYCLPGIGYAQVQEVLHPPLLAEGDSHLPAEVPVLSGKRIAISSKFLSITSEEMKAGLEAGRREKYHSASHQAGDLAALLGMDWQLSSLSYRYIERGEATLEGGELVLISAEMLSVNNRRPQLWELPMVAEEIKAALDQGANPNEISKYGQLFFLHAASDGAAEVVQVLLDAGGNANTTTTKKSSSSMTSAASPL